MRHELTMNANSTYGYVIDPSGYTAIKLADEIFWTPPFTHIIRKRIKNVTFIISAQ